MEGEKKRHKNLKRIILSFTISSILLLFVLYMQVFNIYHPSGFFVVEEKNKIDYLVHLIDNEFSDKKVLGMGENYLYSYTDYIEMKNSYTADIPEDIKVNYNYRVEATLIARYVKSAGMANNPIVMKKTYMIDAKAGDFIGSSKIDNTYDINLDPYKNEFDRFTETVTIPISTEIKIDFIMELNSQEEIKSTFKRGITIPLSEEFYNITIEGEETKESEYNSPKKTVFSFLIIGTSAFTVISFAGLFISIRLLLKNKPRHRLLIDKYLRTYDDIITSVKTKIDFESYKVMEVSDFKELLNLATNTGTQVIFYEEDEKAYFYVLYNQMIYLCLVLP